MKKLSYLLLLLLPSISQAYQSEVYGGYADFDLDLNSSVTTYGVGYKYYLNDLSYGGKPFKEEAFLTSTSSAEVLLTQSDYSVSGLTADGTIFGVDAIIYSGVLAVNVSYLSGTVSSNFGSDTDSTSLSLQPGFKPDVSSLIYAVINYETEDDVDSETYGIGYKIIVDNKINLQLEFTATIEEEVFGDVKTNQSRGLIEYYLSNTNFIGVEFILYGGSGSESDSATGISVGGLQNKNIRYELSYIVENTDGGSDSNAFIAELGYKF